ncbi:MAG TPA: peptide deformylase [Fimbriimonadaceae bacterium]|nr:peptide deformylase [Fimbriimonadaceae bacterium]
MEINVPEELKFLYVQNEQRPVVKIPAPVLRETAKVVTKISKRHQDLIDRMLRSMDMARGIGLAAPQLGVSERVIVVAPVGMRPMALINPRIVKAEGSMIGQEGCLSIPGLYGDVERFAKIEVEAIDRRGKKVHLQMEEMASRVAQHEIDHLDGILFIDKVDQSTLHWVNPEAPGDDEDDDEEL